MLALICTVDPTTGFAGIFVRNRGARLPDVDVALRAARPEENTDARSRRSRSLNVHSKDFAGFFFGANRLVGRGWIDISEPDWIAAVFVPVTWSGIMLAATFVLLNGMSAYSDVD